eukprot:4633283-Amphidinium_carterae.5
MGSQGETRFFVTRTLPLHREVLRVRQESSAEAELIVLSVGYRCWKILGVPYQDIGFTNAPSVRCFCDNQAVIDMLSGSPPPDVRTRHISIKGNELVLQVVQDSDCAVMSLEYISTKLQAADGLTKLLGGESMQATLESWGLVRLP